MNQIKAKEISFSWGGHQVLFDVDFTAEDGKFVGLIGPNGSGKSTFLKCVYRVLKQDSGCVYINGRDTRKMSYKETARLCSVVAQHNRYDFDFSVKDVVMMGRSPHKAMLQHDTAEDYRIVREALREVGMGDFEKRSFGALSGGEQQRVILARALAQQTPILILDEPTNHLDIKYQLQLLNTVKNQGKMVVAAFHDLNIASMYCDKIYVLESGRIWAEGSPSEILTEELIWKVYGVHAQVMPGPRGYPYIQYLP